MAALGHWQDWLFTAGYVALLGFIAYQVLKPQNPER